MYYDPDIDHLTHDQLKLECWVEQHDEDVHYSQSKHRARPDQ